MPVAEGFRTWVRCPPPPPSQPIRTALRGLDEIEDLEGGLGLVLGPANLRTNRDQPDGSEHSSKGQRRRRRLGVEYLLDGGQPLGHPLDRRSLEQGFGRRLVGLELGSERCSFLLGGAERLAESSRALSVPDEVDVVRDPPLLRCQRGPLEGHLLGEVCVKSLDLFLHALQEVTDRRRIGEPLPNSCQDRLFGCPTGHEQLVVTGAAHGGETAVVPAALAAHLADGAAALRAAECPRQQVRGIGLDVAALPSLGCLLTAPSGPRAVDLFPAGRHPLPQFLRDDPQALVLGDVPLALRLQELPPPSGFRIAPRLRAVPRPAADVLLVLEDPADGRGGPAAAQL